LARKSSEKILPKKLVYKQFLLVLIVLALAALACNLPSKNSATSPTAVPYSPEEAQQFEENLQATLTSQQPGDEVTITIEEGQLSSYLAAQLAGQTDQVITNPRVHLTNGRMEVTVTVKLSEGMSLDAIGVVVPSVESDGQPRLKVESVTLGSLPVPDTLINQFQDMVDSMLANYLGSSGTSITITKIEISEGKMMVSGIRK
jgi:uncharacterized protein YpmS